MGDLHLTLKNCHLIQVYWFEEGEVGGLVGQTHLHLVRAYYGKGEVVGGLLYPDLRVHLGSLVSQTVH